MITLCTEGTNDRSQQTICLVDHEIGKSSGDYGLFFNEVGQLGGYLPGSASKSFSTTDKLNVDVAASTSGFWGLSKGVPPSVKSPPVLSDRTELLTYHRWQWMH